MEVKVTLTRDQADIDQCIDLARKLPTYFSSKAFDEMASDFRSHELYIAKNNKQLLGFISINKKNEAVAEISWLAVAENHHRNGIGTILIDTAVRNLKENDYRLLEVKTLARTADYEPYLRTHSFYQKHGFLSIETISPFPGWGAENPCEIYIKII